MPKTFSAFRLKRKAVISLKRKAVIRLGILTAAIRLGRESQLGIRKFENFLRLKEKEEKEKRKK